ncbi:MAG TPA: tetratricopeptide repeat protein [Gemmatimonadaceae bacterium]|nr:tetratricopeptide repeat protein [Gemmatimonadaceae bacterium]
MHRTALAFGLITLGLLLRPAAAAAQDAPSPSAVQAISLLGDTLRAPALPPATRERYEAQLAEARREAAARPDDPDALIWVGRRMAYLGRFQEAIAVFTEGTRRFPDDARIWRHRGHRWLTVRQLNRAVHDLERAAALVRGHPDEVEPDGQPNASGIPVSTLQGNIWYHLGLAHYLRGDMEAALPVWQEAMRARALPDSRVAAAHWTYLTLRRLGRDAEARALVAPFSDTLRLIENENYLRLLLLYNGTLTPDALLAPVAGGATSADVSVAYGVSAWYRAEGRPVEADRVLRAIVAGSQWPAFGYLAAEADLARLR